VTNRTLQRLFDRDVYAARNLLSDLRDRGLLDKIGTARGGRGVKYGPGRKFPEAKRSTDPESDVDKGSVRDQLRLPE
jgi:hypothetical protein